MQFRQRTTEKTSLILKIKPKCSEFLVREIKEVNIEFRRFVGFVKSIVDISYDAKRLLLMDSAGDLIYCLLTGVWAINCQSLRKGYTLELGPSKVLKVPENLRSFYAPDCGSKVCDYYFHYDNTVLQIRVHDEITLLNSADLLGYTESIVNVIGAVLDITFERQKRGLVKVLSIIDSSITAPVQIYVFDSNKVINVGDIVTIAGVAFTNSNGKAVGIVAPETTVIVQSLSTTISISDGYALLEHIKSLAESNQLSIGNREPSLYFCLLFTCNNFPEKGKYTMIVYDHLSFYFLVNPFIVSANWIQVKRARISHGHIELSEDSIVCGYPEWMQPVSIILREHQDRLTIVMQEAKRKTNYFEFIMLDNET